MFLPVSAAVGLSLAPAPDVANYLPFLKPLVTTETIVAGLATVLAPAVAATIFIILGLAAVHCTFSKVPSSLLLSILQGSPLSMVLSLSLQANSLFSRSLSLS